MKFTDKLKYTLLKAIDLSGMTFLSPVVRLCYGEEPKVQLQKIGQWIIVPVVGVFAFLFLWHVTSGSIKTKSGTLPNPEQTWRGYKAINAHAEREELKMEAYDIVGDEREEMLADAQLQLSMLEQRVESSNLEVTKAKEAIDQQTKALIEPLDREYKEKKSKFKSTAIERKESLVLAAESLPSGNIKAYEVFLADVKAAEARNEADKDVLSLLKKEIDKIREIKSPAVADALIEQTLAAEEQQFLRKKIELLSDRNRAIQVEVATGKIVDHKKDFLSLTGKDAYAKARTIAREQSRLSKMESSSYAKPATIWYQVKRSVFCVLCFYRFPDWHSDSSTCGYPLWLEFNIHGCNDSVYRYI